MGGSSEEGGDGEEGEEEEGTGEEEEEEEEEGDTGKEEEEVEGVLASINSNSSKKASTDLSISWILIRCFVWG